MLSQNFQLQNIQSQDRGQKGEAIERGAIDSAVEDAVLNVSIGPPAEHAADCYVHTERFKRLLIRSSFGAGVTSLLKSASTMVPIRVQLPRSLLCILMAKLAAASFAIKILRS